MNDRRSMTRSVTTCFIYSVDGSTPNVKSPPYVCYSLFQLLIHLIYHTICPKVILIPLYPSRHPQTVMT